MRFSSSFPVAAGLLLLSLLGCQAKPAALVIEPAQFLPLERKGKTVQLKAQTKDSRNIFIAVVQPQWKSSDPGVATVGPDGLVTAVGTGTATITGEFEGVSATVPVEVRVVGTVEVEPKEPQKMKLGKTLKVNSIVKDDRGRVLAGEKVMFKNIGDAIGVDPDGTVTAQALGEAVLVVRAKDKEARVSFTVVD